MDQRKHPFEGLGNTLRDTGPRQATSLAKRPLSGPQCVAICDRGRTIVMDSNNTPANTPQANIVSGASSAETERRAAFRRLQQASPLPAQEQLANLGLFMSRQALSRVLWIHELYLKALPIHGVIAEFGTRWGQNAALFSNLRGIYEPYNYTRRMLAFDTFAGFPSVAPQDGADPIVRDGAYAVTREYEQYLAQVLTYHESESPLAHIGKHSIVKGDVTKTLPNYLREHPETIIALAYFDMDLYEPTLRCLEALRPHLTRGTVLAFDELNYAPFPGETVAVREALGLDRYSIRRSVFSPTGSYLVIE
jgi:Macrocin-O-methyltransferase (TylF)